uniref:Chromatin assembly factor 1 subunit B n=1 Tax=Plectus sambesii TaxID=2011161 RepID=A0A914V5U3_9BILA
MKHYMPQISWHDRSAILSVDFQLDQTKLDSNRYKLVTSSVAREVRVWEFGFDTDEKVEPGAKPALAVDFVANLIAHQFAVNVVRFSPSGLKLASGDSDGLICIWHVNHSSAPDIFANEDMPPNKENWMVAKRLFGHVKEVCDLCWSPDGSLIASVSVDKSLIIYNAETGKNLRILKDYKQFPNGVCWDPRGKYVVTMSTDREMHIVNASSQKFARLRRVTKAELPQLPICNAEAGTFKLFHDDQLMTFVRSADFSADGELLIVPSGLLEFDDEAISVSYVFLRGNLECPVAVLPCSSPTYVARCCPVLFDLRKDDEDENFLQLPHRVVFALLTKDSVLLYDSQHALPFAFVDSIHYSNLTDIAWSPDGRVLLVSSTDGYCSFIRFDPNELGQRAVKIATPPPSPLPLPSKTPNRPRVTPKPINTPDGLKSSSKSAAKVAESGATPPTANVTTPKTRTLLRFLKKPTDSPLERSKLKEAESAVVGESPAASSADPKSSVDSTPPVIASEAAEKQPRRVQLISLVPASANPVVVTRKTDDQH